MTVTKKSARARTASGRFLLTALSALAVAACATVAGTPTGEPATPSREPVVAPGGAAPGEEARAAALLRTAEEAMEAGRPAEAAEVAQAVVERYPTAAVSGRALRLRAEASLAAGAWDAAAEAAARYDALLPEGDERAGPVRLLGARALLERGDPAPALEVLLSLRGTALEAVVDDARALARRAAQTAEPATVAATLGRAPAGHPLRPTLQARAAATLQAGGEDLPARELAQAALDAGAVGADAALAREVLSGEFRPRVRSVRIGQVLPTSGSPSLQEFARRIAEGVEVAAVSAGEGLTVAVDARDDHGNMDEARTAVQALSGADVLGAVGFLQDHVLQAAAEARSGPLPLVSPTARTTGGALGAYAMAGPDREAARAVARYAAGQGYARVAILASQSPESAEEADAFEAEAGQVGLPVVGRFTYPAGATFFQEQIRGVREQLRLREIRALNLGPEDTLRVEELAPVALFLPIPPEDVELLAPQLTFFGLDTLGIDILGTAGWTDDEVLRTVDRRHTDRVVATAPVAAGPGSRGYAAFRDAYEAHFRRTLVSPVPALGYDAALLLLQAIRTGAETPEQVRRALEGLQGVEGATGIFSVREGRVVRRQEVVRIMNRALVPAGP